MTKAAACRVSQVASLADASLSYSGSAPGSRTGRLGEFLGSEPDGLAHPRLRRFLVAHARRRGRRRHLGRDGRLPVGPRRAPDRRRRSRRGLHRPGRQRSPRRRQRCSAPTGSTTRCSADRTCPKRQSDGCWTALAITSAQARRAGAAAPPRPSGSRRLPARGPTRARVLRRGAIDHEGTGRHDQGCPERRASAHAARGCPADVRAAGRGRCRRDSRASRASESSQNATFSTPSGPARTRTPRWSPTTGPRTSSSPRPTGRWSRPAGDGGGQLPAPHRGRPNGEVAGLLSMRDIVRCWSAAGAERAGVGSAPRLRSRHRRGHPRRLVSKP